MLHRKLGLTYSGLQLAEVHKEIMNHRWTLACVAQRSCKEGFPTQATGVSPADRLRQRRQACRRHTRRGVPPSVQTAVQMDTDELVLHSDEKHYNSYVSSALDLCRV